MVPKRRKLFRLVVIFFLILSIAPIIFFSAVYIYIEFFFNMCEVENFGVTPSPNGKMSVVIYSIDCGAATRFNRRASLAPANRDFDPRIGRQFLHVRGQHDIRAKWVDAAIVEITVPDSNEVYDEENIVQKEALIDGVFIIYK